MDKEEKLKKGSFEIISGIIVFLIAMGFGMFSMGTIEQSLDFNWSFGVRLIIIGISIYLALYIQIIVHEAGHLVMGILTGYKFASFRVGSLIIYRSQGGLKLERFEIPGTGGQCLLYYDGKAEDMPIVLYNLGGGIFNLLLAGTFHILNQRGFTSPLLIPFLSFGRDLGIFFALVNLIPLKPGGMSNDGLNIYYILRDRNSRLAFYAQLKINFQIMEGLKYRDIDSDLLKLDGDLNNPLIAAINIYSLARMIDREEYYEAGKRIDLLLEARLLDVHRKGVLLEKVYLEIVAGNIGAAREIMNKDLSLYMDKMGAYDLDVLRTSILYYAYVDLDLDRINKGKEIFKKAEKKYIYRGAYKSNKDIYNRALEIIGEREKTED